MEKRPVSTTRRFLREVRKSAFWATMVASALTQEYARESGRGYRFERWKNGGKNGSMVDPRSGAEIWSTIRSDADLNKDKLKLGLTTVPRAERRAMLASVIGSGYQDTLKVLFGSPQVGIVERFANEDIAGAYNLRTDVIQLSANDALSETGVRYNLAHEFGHAWQARQGAFLGKVWKEYDIKAPNDSQVSYSAYDRTEHQAEAVAVAMAALDILGREKLDERFRVILANALCKDVPGSRTLTRIFLSHPLFANHPAHKMSKTYRWEPLPAPMPWNVGESWDSGTRISHGMEAVKTGVSGWLWQHNSRSKEEEFLAKKNKESLANKDKPGPKRSL